MGISTMGEGGGPMLLAFGSFVAKLTLGKPLHKEMPISLHSDARIKKKLCIGHKPDSVFHLRSIHRVPSENFKK
jgi:hypothetical protein